MIQFDNLSIRRGENLLFDGATCQIHPGQKVGLTGANGCGKSSLFAVLRNELVIDKGDVKVPKDWVLAHVSQEAPANDRPAIEHVLDGDEEWRELDEKIKNPDHPRFLKFQSRYEEIDGYSARSRAAQLLDGLGFKSDEFEKPAQAFSGGWRVRLNVAKALMCRSDLLLLDHMQDFVRRFRAKATKATQAQSRLKALEKMERIAPAHVDSPFSFSIPAPEKNPSPLLSLHDASVGYENKTIVEAIEFAMTPGDRVGLIGPNGAGKSTLIKLLAGELKLITGNYHTSKEINIGYFAQHQIEQLQMEHTPMEHMAILDKECNNAQATENQLRRYLGSFGFSGTKATSKVKPFSGGEKSRLALALICYQRPNLLLLDEPTNHLDLEMRQALAVALQEYSGAVVLVSHDRHLLKVNSDKLILVANGRAAEFKGSVDDYPKWLAEHNRGVTNNQLPPTTEERKPKNTAAAKKEQKRLDAERRKQLQPLTSKIKRAERVMEKLGKEKD